MSLQACADQVRQGDPDRFLATMAAPVDARRVLFPLYAFNLEIARAPWVSTEPMIAEMRMQWWRDALVEIAEGGPVRRHEVLDALKGILDPDAVADLDALIAARYHDVDGLQFSDHVEFDDYIDKTSGNLMWVAARALGATDPAPVRDIAFSAGLASWFRAVPEFVARGRQPSVDERGLAVRALAERGLTALDRARGAVVPREARPALYSAWEAGRILRMVREEPDRVIEGRLVRSEFARRVDLLRTVWLGRI